jgi:hypothetical protein
MEIVTCAARCIWEENNALILQLHQYRVKPVVVKLLDLNQH